MRSDLSCVLSGAIFGGLLYENEIAISPVNPDTDCVVSSFRVK